jgi:PAS domain S-box-containing protein
LFLAVFTLPRFSYEALILETEAEGMLQNLAIGQLRNSRFAQWGLRYYRPTRKFIVRRFASTRFRSQLLFVMIILGVINGALVTVVGAWLLQLTTILFLAASIALVLGLSRELHRPLRRLIEGAQRIGNGDFDHRIEVKRDNEFGRLASSFNQMASYLKLREQQLQRSEALHRHLIRDAHDGIFVVDRNLRFIEVNEKFCQFLGRQRKEVLQSTLAEIIAQTMNAEEQVNDLLARRPFRGELIIQPQMESSTNPSPRGLNVSGSQFLQNEHYGVNTKREPATSNGHGVPKNARLLRVSNITGGSGAPTDTSHRRDQISRIIDLNAAPISTGPDEFYMGIARDITEKKHYEAELHRAAELRELLLRTMNDGVAVLDQDGYLLIGNRAIEEVFEMSQAELVQYRFTALKNGWQFRALNNGDLPPEENPIELALRRQQRLSDCRLKICRPGREKFLSVNAAPLYDERQELIGAIVALRDISAAVQSERAHELLQQKVQQTAKLASLGELAAGVAHEINNPMTGIISYVQLLLERKPGEQTPRDLLQGILDESDRVTKLVRNLLTFARQQPQEHDLCSLNEILSSSLQLMEHRLRKDGVKLNCEIASNLPPIKCRGQQIQQVFINLLSNAHHALNDKYPRFHANKMLNISASSLRRNGRQIIRTEFCDTGAGIAPEIMPKIFDPFFTTKSRSQGTGLGLSISYGIIKEHQGEILVESEPGIHTTFTVELPIEADDVLSNKNGNGRR